MTSEAAGAPATARIVAVGTELLGGKRDLNGPELARRLRARGVEVEAILVLPDDRRALAEEIRRSLELPGLLVLLGGLGPTSDDLTREALSDATGRGVEEDPAARARIEELALRRGRPVTAAALRQALVPAGAEVVPNPTGYASGAVLGLERSVVLLLPGPPGELAAMVEDGLDRAQRAMAERGLVARTPRHRAEIVLAGVGESDAEARLGAHPALEGMGVAWLARPGEVRLFVAHEDEGRVRDAVAAARAAFGRDLVSIDGRSVVEIVLATLAEREESLAVAESCTGGLVAAEITSIPGSSAVFRRGFVVYSDDAKSEILGVPPQVLAEHGAVSAEVAEALAHGARRAGRSDWGVGITGIAGPGGATPGKPVGLVHWAVARPDGRVDSWRAELAGGRDDVRRRAVAAALDSVRRLA